MNAYELFQLGKKTEDRGCWWCIATFVCFISMIFSAKLIESQFDKWLILMILVLLFGTTIYMMTSATQMKEKARKNFGSNWEEHF